MAWIHHCHTVQSLNAAGCSLSLGNAAATLFGGREGVVNMAEITLICLTSGTRTCQNGGRVRWRAWSASALRPSQQVLPSTWRRGRSRSPRRSTWTTSHRKFQWVWYNIYTVCVFSWNSLGMDEIKLILFSSLVNSLQQVMPRYLTMQNGHILYEYNFGSANQVGHNYNN